MKILMINSLPNGSTGKIMFGIQDCAEKNGHTTVSYFGNWKNASANKSVNKKVFGYKWENYLHALLGRIIGCTGFLSLFGTIDLLLKIRRFKPDVIHMHNIHLWVVCYPLLIYFIKKNKIPLVWTLHDCWSFTGHCPYFTMVNCERWMSGCHDCPQLRRYPTNYVDLSRLHWKIKKYIYQLDGVINIITPSNWLANLCNKSILKNNTIKVINNGIDLNVFKPKDSDFRKKHNIPNDIFLILGVAFGWEKRKGLDIFVNLDKELDNSKYKIVLVGTNPDIDKIISSNIISIHKTNNQEELAQIYSACDVLLNPTREENYPTVNMEAIACGIPVITFKTGGSPEIVNKYTGIVIEDNSYESALEAILKVSSDKCFSKKILVQNAKRFDKNLRFIDYIDLFEKMCC